MPETNEPIQVDTTKVTKGAIKYFGSPSLPTPTILARVTKALRYFCTSLIVMINSASIFDAQDATIYSFWIGAFILVLGGIDIIVGVEPETKQPYSAPKDESIN